MKKSIFLFFAAILCATSAWGNTIFQAGEILFYDFSAITGGANWSWNNGGGLAYDANAQNSVKAIIFTAKETWNPNKVIAKTNKGGWADIKFKDRTAGTNCIKIGADGKSYTWTTHSIEEDILSGNYIMVYGGELSSWKQTEYWFLTEAIDERKAAVAKTNLSITINSEAYKMGLVLLPAGSTSYIQGHWNSGMKCSVEAGSAYVVRSSTTKTNYTQKAKNGNDYLYQVKQNATAPTKTLSPTCPTKILQGEKLSFSHGAAGVSVLGKTNTVKYYLQNGTTYTEKTLTGGTIDVSDLPAGNYSIITLLYDGNIYVKASTSNFTIESAYDVTFANDGNGTTNQTGTIKVGSSTGIVIDATPSTDYEFKAWESSNGGSFATTAADASNTFYPTANTTLTATFRSTAVNALLVVAGENITSVTGSAEPVTLGDSYPISATFPAGYKFTTWTAEPAANATFADAASATTDVTVLNGSVTVTASAEEVLSILTTANEYNEGTPTIAAPTASVAKIGVTTTATVTAAAGTGYTFAGWKLDNCVRTDAGADNATTITVKSNGDGVAAKVTAKYEQNVVYFVNTKGWSTVKVYAWNDGGASNAAWSGLALTADNVVKQIGGCDVYKYVPGDNYAKVIFNNGSEQTDDLTWQNGKYYVYNSENSKDVSDWYDESEVEGVLPDPVELKYTVEVPAGTHECYIAGDMNGWALTKMDPIDATHFTLTIQWATNAHKYKYAAGPDWAYVEVKADGGEVADRTYNANDKVAKWKNVYNPSATVYDYYIVGTMNGWSEINENYGMSKVGETTTYSKELNLAAGTYEFKVKKNGGDWFGEYEGDYKEVSYKDGNIQIVLTAATNVTIKFDSNTKKISFAGLTRPGRYLTGNDAVFGYTDGNWTPNTIQMTLDEANGIYTYTTPTLNANQNYIFRVTNGTWDVKWGYDKLNPAPENVLSFGDDKNICFMLASAGTITVTLDGDKLGLTTSSSFAAPVYTLVGDAAITGVHWDVNSAENQMVQDATDKNKFTLVKTVTAVAGEYEYKAIRNHSYEWEVAGDKVKIEKDGTGKITYTLDIATPKLTAAVSDWVEETVAQVVTLVGIGDDKEFTENADHKTTSVAVSLEANSVYSFNIVANSVYLKNKGVMWRGNCEGWAFTNEGDKAHIITDLAGTYTFTWTYDGNKLSVTYPDGTNVPAPVFLAGDMNGWERLATRLIPSADGKTASATVTLNRNEKSNFRMVVGTEDWTNPGEMKRTNCTGWTFEKVTGSNKDVNASILPDYTDEYTFTWTYADNKLSVTYPTEECTDCSGYYLVGQMNEWNQLKDEFMKTEGTAIEVSLELTAGTYEFKIKNGDTWYTNQDANITRTNNTKTINSTSGNNAKFAADIDGVYTFTYTTDQKKLTVTYPEIIIGDGDNSSVLNNLNGVTVDLKVTRSFASGTLYTLALPFAMDNNTVKSIFGTDVELYDFTSLSENTSGELILSFTKQATPAIAAGTPYLIKPKTIVNGFDLTGVTIKTATNPVVKTYGTTTITMQPVLSATAEAKTNGVSQYWLAADNNLYNNIVSIKGLRAIFDVQTTKANVRARAAFNENVETGVEDLFTTDTPVKAIVNGQLIIIRDGVKYNVQGQLVK